MKRLLCMISAAALVLTCCACNDSESSAESTAAPVIEQKTLVTLGDSIAAGYGLENAEATRYSALLTQQLTTESVTWRDCNYAVSGDTATQLVERLENGRAVRLPSADVITISIGANHMLQPFGAFYGRWLARADDIASPDKAFAEMETEILAGLQEFETQLPLIYDHIRGCNTEGLIILQTVYNPFADTDVEIKLQDRSIALAAYAEEQIMQCNAIITDFAQTHTDVMIADVHAAFADESTVPIIGEKGTQQAYYIDPHPNAKGHEIIAEVIADIIHGAEA